MGTYSAWESTPTLHLLGCARGVWAPTVVGEGRGCDLTFAPHVSGLFDALLMRPFCLCTEFVMAENSCDTLSDANNGPDLVNHNDWKQHEDERRLYNLACVLCNTAVCSVTQRVKVLPCLHLTCRDCLMRFLVDKWVQPAPLKGVDFSSAIFSCPRCRYTIQLPRDGVAGLKDATFLQVAGTRSSGALSVAAEYDSRRVSGNEGGTDNCTPFVTQSVGPGHDDDGDPDIEGTALSLDNPTLSLLSEIQAHHSEKANPPPRHSGSNCCGVEKLWVSSTNCEDRFHCDASVDDAAETEAEVAGSTMFQIRSRSQEMLLRRRHCERSVRQIKLAACDLEARKLVLRDTVAKRADLLCDLVRSRCHQLLGELDREHLHTSAEYGDRIKDLEAYGGHLKDSGQFASVLLAAGNTSEDLKNHVLERLNQLVLCDMPGGVLGPGDVPETTAMRLDVPDTRHEESHLERMFGTIVRGTVGTVEVLTSFHTDVQWPTGFVVTSSHDTVLTGQ